MHSDAEIGKSLRTLVDRTATTRERTTATMILARCPEAPVLEPLCAVAEDSDNAVELLEAVGRAVARVTMSRGGTDDTFFLANWADAAFLAFDEELAVIANERE